MADETKTMNVIKNLYVRQQDTDATKAQIQVDATNVILTSGMNLQEYIDNYLDRLWKWFENSKLKSAMPYIGDNDVSPLNCLAYLNELLAFLPESASADDLSFDQVRVSDRVKSVTTYIYKEDIISMDATSQQYHGMFDTLSDWLELKDNLKQEEQNKEETDNDIKNTIPDGDDEIEDDVTVEIADPYEILTLQGSTYYQKKDSTDKNIYYEPANKHIILNNTAYIKVAKKVEKDENRNTKPVINLNYCFVENGMFK